ncbi:uncharacterized protein L201_005437 [Kwoniella dendrophila CBS 6074]|uniref:GH18 domain-containing protein n=1 Tax=Kwoniella dendrophila CBS 6074 TaxID=1295534 RepID=A0AAX4JZ39_9TREE
MTSLKVILGLLPLLSSVSAIAVSEVERSCQSCNGGWSGYRNVGYFTNWGIYDPQDYFVTNISAKEYTHMNYAFANVDINNGTVFLGDLEADIQTEYPGDNLNATGNNVYGNLKQLYLLKKKNRNLKTLLSIGGATYSENFANITQAKWRETFVNTSITLLNDYGFDGLDIDFGMLNELAAAVGCGEAGWHGLDVKGMDKCLDFWNLMAYDFSGEWTPTALPAANLWPDNNPANDVGVSGHQCVQHYLGEGVNSRKLVLGMPLYGTAFNGTQGMWTNWTDIGGGDYDQAGNYDDKHLPLEGTVLFYNKTLEAAWSFDNKTGHVVSFDTPTTTLAKAKYIMKNQLGGMMYWSIDQDFSKLQSEGKPNGKIWPGVWDRLKGHSRKVNYGKWKGAPWPLPESFKYRPQSNFKRSIPSSITERAEIETVKERGFNFEFGGNWNNWNIWGQWEQWSNWRPKITDNICLNIGYSLVDTVKTAFEKYGGGLDRSKNNLNYPHSVYDNIRNGMA